MNSKKLKIITMKQQAAKSSPLLLCCLSLLLFSLFFTHPAKCIDRRHNHQASSTTSVQHNSNNNHHQDTNQDQSQDSNQESSAGTANFNEQSGGEPPETSSPFQAPTELEIVRLNDTSVVLKWDIPFAAHERLEFFKIQYKSTRRDSDWRTDNREILPTTKAYQINGLRPGNYFFIVSAVYDNDDNVPSQQLKYRLRARSKISSKEMPEQKAPEIFWSQAESDYIRFKWRYEPKEEDMPSFGYLVYYRSAHAVTDFTIYNTLDENVEIAELEPETPYEAKVVAYNGNGVSDFSETIRIKTKAKSNTTSSAAAPTTAAPTTVSIMTTRKPSNSQAVTESSESTSTLSPSMTASNNSSPIMIHPNPTTPVSPAQPTSRPMNARPSAPTATGGIIISGSTTTTTTTTATNSTTTAATSPYHSLISMIDLLIGGNQNDTTLVIRYLLLVLLPLVFIVFASICLISCHHRRNSSPPSSTHDSIQFDLEINGYFKNSFPGVEKEYSSIANHHAHHGFVNNHPHINDFA